MSIRKPLEDGKVLGLRTGSEYDSIEVHSYGRWPETRVRTIAPAGDFNLKIIAPNGRTYDVQLDGNALRVSTSEGSIWVHPKADNLVELVNLTPFERDVEERLR
jgi:hypothetical protein